MKKFLTRAAIAAAAASPVAAFASGSSTSDPIATATAQLSTWQPEIVGLLAAAFLVAVAFKGLRLGKRGVNAA